MPNTTRIGFRNRPIHPDFAVATQISRSLRGARSYQRQHVALTDGYVSASIAVAGFTAFSHVALQPGDKVIAAWITVPTNTAGTTYDVEINGTLRGASLNGPWTLVPNVINILPWAVPNPATNPWSAIYARLKNTAGATSTLEFQLQVIVLR